MAGSHTLLMGHIGTLAVNVSLYPKLRYVCGTDLHLLLSLKDGCRPAVIGLRQSPLGCIWLPLTYRNGG